MAEKKTQTDWDKIVKTFRKHMNMTQTELAEAIGTRQSTIVRWESGAEPRVDGFKRLAEFARSKNYNLEVPWEAGSAAIKLVGVAKEYGVVERRPKHPDDPAIPLDIGFYSSSVKEAIEVQGDGLMPRLMDGDLICISRINERFTQTEAGILVISFKDAALYIQRLGLIKEVERPWIDRDTGAPLTVEWAGMVKFIVPAGSWRKARRGLDWMVQAEAVRKK